MKFLTYLCPIQGAQLLESNIVIRSISPAHGRCVMTSIISRMLLLETYKRISVLLLCFFFLDWCLIFVFDRTNCATKKPLLFNYYSTEKIILMRFLKPINSITIGAVLDMYFERTHFTINASETFRLSLRCSMPLALPDSATIINITP